DFKPDVIHCHDWQTGLIPVYLKTIYADRPIFAKAKTVFTVHNLGYQGNFPPDSMPLTGLGWELFKLEKLEFYGKVSFLKGGLVYADAITTVSERYSQEIQTKEFGCGLDGVLRLRKDHLFGIINGIDFDDWNPDTDENIFSHYNIQSIQKKYKNKSELQKENDLWVDFKLPLIGVISRLVDQKGINVLIPALAEIAQLGFQFVLLGTGEEKYHQLLREIAKRNRGQFGIHILFDAAMARRIYAGCDIMLFPSYYEPCGLGQLIAMRYGAIPIVRATGGLADTVHEFHPETGEGNGFLFQEYSSEALMRTLKHALSIYRNEKAWGQLVKNAMKCDFSWNASAKKFIHLYEMISQSKNREIKK
ncbi:MAG: glycogen synthase, partial [Candidatus Omnitrophica bacterium]|nr:glycogen synthase [Candidatus Omnitrophota bacterium]